MINQMNKNRREAYVEVLEILKYMDKKYVSKIPIDLREFFERNASEEYEFHIDTTISLEKHRLKENTINILAMLNINYWCESEEHKQELLKKYHENDLRKEELREKYNTDNLFKKKSKVIVIDNHESINNMLLIYDNKQWYKRIRDYMLKIIKRIFKKL